ncbi:META domain-containing protein [Algoriphagus aestuariicola]|jgi:heat shock protein HslJ|uniref:META domain-containing protein n=1 Tax=Algoriphagus aestuariicola TaxID=1852016 RepID=A0ABS3BU24_9BACT|nr:META domain-containing protein [Algoriphagus aestuariicola]MBN7802810.1 META domain-containing protein [Algoriphagus aestuariicola]
MKTLQCITLSLLLLLINACAGTNNLNPLGALTGKGWELSSLSGQAPDLSKYPAGIPTLNFLEEGRLAGFAGCNNFSGEFALEGGPGAIRLDPGAMTRKACPGSGEEEFIAAFEKAKNFKVEKEKLTLLDGSAELMSFVPTKD